MSVRATFDNYAKFLENLTVEDVPDLKKFVSVDVEFSDPFHHAKGLEDMSKIFIHLFNNVSNISFKTGPSAIKGSNVYFNWKLRGTLAGKPWDVEGVTLLTFNNKIEIIEHKEYWDAASQFYEKLPIIGPMLRYFRRRISRQAI